MVYRKRKKTLRSVFKTRKLAVPKRNVHKKRKLPRKIKRRGSLGVKVRKQIDQLVTRVQSVVSTFQVTLTKRLKKKRLSRSKKKAYAKKRKLKRIFPKKHLVLLLLSIGILGMTFIPGVVSIVSSIELSPPPSTDIDITSSEQFGQVVYSFFDEPVKVDPKLLNAPTVAKPLPNHIIIPSIQIDILVKEAQIRSGYWEVFPDTAGYGKGSGIVGEVGNQVIFAHARPGLFGDLPKITNGSFIYILTQNEWYKYRVVEKKEVTPNQLEVITSTPDETLTLYTCSGLADNKRFIVTAKRAL